MRRGAGVRHVLGALALAVVAAGLAGCTEAADSAQHDNVQPATVADIPGSPVHKVTLTALAVQRLDVKTQPVAAAPGAAPAPGSVQLTAVPQRALVYDPEGRSWVYTNPEPMTFVRASVVLDHVDADLAVLKDGPPLGTAVVTTGAPELLGAEYGVGEE
jgi:hypothetical protein